MRNPETEVRLLESAELLLVSHCECGRKRCSSCALRQEIGEYLDVALKRDDVPEGTVLQ